MVLRFIALFSLLTFCFSAVAENGKVLVADPRVDEGKIDELVLLGAIRGMLRQGVESAIGGRILPEKLAIPATCKKVCLEGLAQKKEVALILIPVFTVGKNTTIRASLYDNTGALIGLTERVYSGNELPPDKVRSLLVELLEPQDYAGILRLEGVPKDARVFVDGIAVEKKKEKGLSLRVGEHRVLFDLGEGDKRTSSVGIKLKETTNLALPSAQPLVAKTVIQDEVIEVRAGFPTWPAYAAGAFTLVTASLTGVYSVAQALEVQTQDIGINLKNTGPVDSVTHYRKAQKNRYAYQGNIGIATPMGVASVVGLISTVVLFMAAKEPIEDVTEAPAAETKSP